MLPHISHGSLHDMYVFAHCPCSSAFVPEGRLCTTPGTMEASPWQLLAARLLATAGAAASSSSQSPAQPMGLGYPGSGCQNAGDAAQVYALYTKLAEQARLAAVAETQLLQQTPAPSSQDDVKEAVRQMVRQEMQAARSEHKPVDKDNKLAKEDIDGQNAAEEKLDADRRAYKAERAQDTAASDRRTTQYARDVFLKEQKAAEEAQKSKKSGPAPPASRPNLRCVGGYRIQGGYIEVWSRFRACDKNSDPAEETTADEVTEQPSEARASSHKDVGKDKVKDVGKEKAKEVRQDKAKDIGKDKAKDDRNITATKDDRTEKTAKLRPREPDYPPGCKGIKPPPPPVDWKKDGKRILGCMNPCVSLVSHVLDYLKP